MNHKLIAASMAMALPLSGCATHQNAAQRTLE